MTGKQELCENCGIKINVPETALKLCDKCFNEKCECGHIRAEHIDNNGSCIHEFSLQHKTKRGEFCPCKKFKAKSDYYDGDPDFPDQEEYK